MNNTLIVRTINPVDFDEYINLSSQAFGVSLEGERRLLDAIDTEQVLIGEFEGKIVAQLMIHRLGIWINGGQISLGGIGGVTTAPEHRGKGYATMLLQKALVHMRDRIDCSVSALYPTTYSLYHCCGWAIGDKGYLYKAAPPAFRPVEPILHVRIENRIAGLQDINLLQSIRHRFAATNQAYIEKDVLGWHIRVFGKFYEKNSVRWLALHYNDQGQADGYLLYEFLEHKCIKVHELVYHTPVAFDGLLSFISEQSSQASVSVRLSIDAPLLTRVANPLTFEIVYDPMMLAMYRIVDVNHALTDRLLANPEITGEFTLQVIDQIAPWNDGHWLIHTEKGGTECKKISSAIEPDVALDISVLSQLLVGYLSVRDAIKNRLVRLDHPVRLYLLESFFESQSSPFSGDHF